MDGNTVLLTIVALVIAYFLGSIPAAYVAGRLKKGIDIRTVGTKNMGAMNSFYQLGFATGLMVLFTDIGKGVLALAIARWMGLPEISVYLAGLFAIIGHNYTIWLKFRGGKGGATLIGIFIFLMPWGIPIGLGIFGLLMLVTKFPTLSYGIGLASFPFIAWLINGDGGLVIYTILMLLMPLIHYIPRIKQIYSRAGGAKEAIFRKNIKTRM